jgi:transposase
LLRSRPHEGIFKLQSGPRNRGYSNPTNGRVFVFFNRRRDQVKALWWDETGWAIWYKRLERGTFRPGEQHGSISPAELSMILEGIVAKGIRRLPRFHLENRHPEPG